MPLLRTSENSDQLTLPCPAITDLDRDEHGGAALSGTWRRALDANCLFRQAVLKRLNAMHSGRLTLVDGSGAYEFGETGTTSGSSRPASDPANSLAATLQVHHRRFYRQVALGGGLGAAESYLRGDWDAPDLTKTMRLLARNMDVLEEMEHGAARLLRPLRTAANWLRRNTRSGSKRNIAAHYDLSNDFFKLLLDPTMTYSSGVFPHEAATLEEASIEKYDRICRKLQLTPQDHVLEIGTGWGGFTEHAVKNYGCRVTTTTISDEQHDYAARRFRESGVTERVTLLKDDYRDLQGQFDRVVSIEMIEAVGEAFLPSYFAKCSDLLNPQGIMCLQAITIPDHRYDAYRKSVDFIQRYIFPGGFLPSIGAIATCLGQVTDFRLFQSEDFGPHYATTLAHWRRNFWEQISKVKSLGFDERFIRTWHYYLCYCEAGFHERQIGVSQLVLTKPGCRRGPLLIA